MFVPAVVLVDEGTVIGIVVTITVDLNPVVRKMFLVDKYFEDDEVTDIGSSTGSSYVTSVVVVCWEDVKTDEFSDDAFDDNPVVENVIPVDKYFEDDKVTVIGIIVPITVDDIDVRFKVTMTVDVDSVVGILVPVTGITLPVDGIVVPFTVDSNSGVENIFPVDKCFEDNEVTAFGIAVPIVVGSASIVGITLEVTA